MEDEELVKMFNPTLKRREAILFFLIVVINGLNVLSQILGQIRAQGGVEKWRFQNWK